MNITKFDPYQPANVGDEFSIPDCLGLRLRVGVASRTWFIRYREPSGIAGVAGKLREGRLGLLGNGAGYLTLIQAIAAWQEKKDAIAKGLDPFQAERAAKAEQRSQKEQFSRTSVTVRQMAEQWMELHTDKLARGWEVRRMLTQEFERAPKFAELPADNLRLTEVSGFLEGIIARPAPAIARMTRQALGQAFEWAAAKGLVSDTAQNQFQRVMRGDKRLAQNKKDRVLSDAELAAFFPWLEAARLSKSIQAILRLIIFTGMRPGEVCGMAWANIDMEKGVYHLPAGKSKTDKARDVQLTHQALEVLRTLQNDANKFVFEARKPNGDSFNKSMSGNSISVGLSYAKVPRPVEGDTEQWTPHDLRRTVRTGLARLGCPMEIGELILGHAVGSGVAEIYNRHKYLDEQREWLQKWCDSIQPRAS